MLIATMPTTVASATVMIAIRRIEDQHEDDSRDSDEHALPPEAIEPGPERKPAICADGSRQRQRRADRRPTDAAW